MTGFFYRAMDEDVVYGGGAGSAFDEGVVGGGAWGKDSEVVPERAGLGEGGGEGDTWGVLWH